MIRNWCAQEIEFSDNVFCNCFFLSLERKAVNNDIKNGRAAKKDMVNQNPILSAITPITQGIIITPALIDRIINAETDAVLDGYQLHPALIDNGTIALIEKPTIAKPIIYPTGLFIRMVKIKIIPPKRLLKNNKNFVLNFKDKPELIILPIVIPSHSKVTGMVDKKRLVCNF